MNQRLKIAGDSTNLLTFEGTGIGLALVKELVDLMDGQVWVESKMEKGSTFFVLLPIERRAPLVSTTLAKPATPAIGSASRTLTPIESEEAPKILIIEDNVDVIYYLKTCLREGWQVATAKNGKEGIQIAREEIPDIIICDVMMPIMNGFEVCEHLKQDEFTNHIPILLLTAKATEQDKLEGLSSGADAYLVKPFNKEELLIRLQNFIKMREALRQKLLSPEQENGELSLEQQFLNKIDAAIQSNLDNADFNTDRLSREVGMSRVQLHRKLKAISGLSTSLYIRQYRLQQARKLLKSTDFAISEIAWKTGFSSLSWFSQAYREAFKESPSSARNKL